MLTASGVFNATLTGSRDEYDSHGNIVLTLEAVAFGVYVTAQASCDLHASGSPDPGPPFYSWTMMMSAGAEANSVGTGTQTATVTDSPDPPPANGSFTISVPVEEWMAVSVIPRSQADIDAGILDNPPRLSATFYEATVPGAAITATGTLWGVSASASIPVADSIEVQHSASNLANIGVTSSGTNIALSASCHFSPSSMIFVPGTLSKSGSHFSASTSAGATVTGTGNYYSGGANADAIGSPNKAFTLSGLIDSVGQPYPGSVTLDCSKFRGDTHPMLTASPSFSAAYGQRQFYETVDAEGIKDSNAIDEWQPLQVSVNDSWCAANGEYVGGNGETVYDDAVAMHGYTFGGLTLSQDAALTLDACTSASGWVGAAVGGGGLQNSGATMVRTFTPAKNLSGYRYLRIRLSVGAGNHPFTLNIGGKQWTKDYQGRSLTATTAATDFDIDLCDPGNDSSLFDTTDTRFPIADPNLSYGYGGGPPAADGTLWGVGYTTSLSITGLSDGSVYTLLGISQVRHTCVTLSFLPSHRPRYDADMLYELPSYTDPDSGTTTEVKCRRYIMADTDGRQSFEFRDTSVTRTVGGSSDLVTYIPRLVPIVELAMPGGASSADAAFPAGEYPGWVGLAGARSNASGNVHGDYLSSDAPATWLMGGGLLYSGGAWQSGVGMDATNGRTIPAQMLFDSIEWYPGIGDVFGLNRSTPATPDGTPIVLVAHKILRAQAHGVLLTTADQSAPGQPVTLTPSGSMLQDDTTPMGWDKSGRPEGEYRTGGPGVIGYTGGSPSSGTVSAVGASATTSLLTRHLSRVALRGTAPPPDCCDQLLFQTPMLHDPLPELPGDADALPVDEWRR